MDMCIVELLKFQTQMRVNHWMTESYAEHKAFGDLYAALDPQIDDFMETYIGIFGRDDENKAFKLEIEPFTSISKLKSCITEFEEFLEELSEEIKGEKDLLNMRDSILGEVSHLRYLLTLK